MKIAVIVPCRNEVNNLEECIRAIYNSKLPKNYSIDTAIVDGKSNDGTLSLIENLQKEYIGLYLVNNEKQLTPFAFNLGIKQFPHADFYQIVGARQIIDENYLRLAVEKMSNNEAIWCVGGKVQNVYLNHKGKVIAGAMSTAFGMGLGNFRISEESSFVDTVGTPMYPKQVFEKIGHFDEELVRNQDDDFNYRVSQAGGKIFFDADISLKYYVRGNYHGLWKQFFQYGYWKVYVNKKHKSVTTLRQLVPPLFVLYLFVLPLCTLLFSNLYISFFVGLPFIVYLLMATYFSFSVAKTDAEISIFSVFKTYLILHLSYGLGYLKGIFHFLVQGKTPSEKEKSLSR